MGDSDEGGLDFISNLHESIITHIMSRLPSTESAMQTSVLSRAWRYNWTSIDNVTLNDIEFFDGFCMRTRRKRPGATEPDFVKFVNRVLSLTKNVTTFRLYFHKEYELDLVKAWISNVLERTHIKTFCLFSSRTPIILGQDLLDHTSLEFLFLLRNLTLNLPVTTCFPNLTTLYFFSIKIVNENSSTNTLTLKLPVLKTCSFVRCTWLNVKVVEIDAPMLTRFLSWTLWERGGVDEYSIKIIGAALAKFQSGGGLPEDYIIQNSSTVVSASFNNSKRDVLDNELAECGLKTRSLLRGLSNLEELMLCDYMAKAIAHSRGIVALPRFDKLKRLILCSTIGETSEWSSKALFDLLHATPVLKLLEIDEIDGVGYDQDNNNIDAMESVPRCITNHLEEVGFRYQAYDSTYEFQLENFF